MKLPRQTSLKPQRKLTQTVSKIEASLVKLKTDLASLEQRLQQTRGEYGRALQHLEEVKAQMALQPFFGVGPLSSGEDIDLETYLDDDWDHLIRQINNL